MNTATSDPDRWVYSAKRVVAFCVDMLVVWIIMLLVLGVAGEAWVALNAALWLGYRAVAPAVLGKQTIGRTLAGLTLRSRSRPGNLSMVRAVGRELPVALVLLGPAAGIVAGLYVLFLAGPVLVATDLAFVVGRADRISMRDLIAGTSVTDNAYSQGEHRPASDPMYPR